MKITKQNGGNMWKGWKFIEFKKILFNYNSAGKIDTGRPQKSWKDKMLL
jgi:hypothetical protein